MKKIALCGYFDRKNWLNSLYFEVLSHELNRCEYECVIDIYGFYSDDSTDKCNKEVYSILDLERKHLEDNYDAFVVIGEKIIDCIIKQHEKVLYTSYIWNIPAMLSERYGVKLIWNTISLTDAFGEEMIHTLVDAMCNADYISTNDYASMQTMVDMGMDINNIKYVPDSLVLVNDYYPKSGLTGIERTYVGNNDYIIVNFPVGLGKENIKSIMNKISDEASRCKVVMLPIYCSEGETELFRQYSDKMGKNVITIDNDLSIKEYLAIIAGAKYVVSENFALAGCAYSYGLQTYIYDFENKLYDIQTDLKTASRNNVNDIVNCMKSDVVKRKSMVNNMAMNYQLRTSHEKVTNMEDEIKVLKGYVDSFKCYKNMYEKLLERYDTDMEEKNNNISKLNRKIYEIENSKAYKIANKFIKE